MLSSATVKLKVSAKAAKINVALRVLRNVEKWRSRQPSATNQGQLRAKGQDGVALQDGDTVHAIAVKREEVYDQKVGQILILNQMKEKLLLPVVEKRDFEYKNLVLLKCFSTKTGPEETNNNGEQAESCANQNEFGRSLGRCLTQKRRAARGPRGSSPRRMLAAMQLFKTLTSLEN